MEVTRGANHQLLVPHYNRIMDTGSDTSHASYGPMMALMTAEQDIEASKRKEQLYCEQQVDAPASHFIYDNDPYQAAAIIQAGRENSHLSAINGQLSYNLPFANPDKEDDVLQEEAVDHKCNLQQRMNISPAAGTIVFARNCDKSRALTEGDMAVLCSQISSVSKSEVMDLAMRAEDAVPAAAITMATELDSQSESLRPAECVKAEERMKEKILRHPDYQRLVMAYINCRKVGAPPDVLRRLEELSKEYDNEAQQQQLSMMVSGSGLAAADPELDHFMNTYCHILQQYEEELSKPFNEAMTFLHKVELQMNQLVPNGEFRSSQPAGEETARILSVEDNIGEEDQDVEEEEEGGSYGEVLDYHESMEGMGLDQQAEDKQLKEQLLRKYRGYISTLKHEFMKKKKKGKLPKDARQRLLDWWHQHYKWPYPSETEKVTLAETTGLDQKQINNWFINQRKRHWKPSDQDVRYVMVNGQDPPMQDGDHQLIEADRLI